MFCVSFNGHGKKPALIIKETCPVRFPHPNPLVKQLIKLLVKQPNSDYDDKTVISSLVNSG